MRDLAAVAPRPRPEPLTHLRVAVGLGGSDLGRSGIGVYVREVIPRLARLLIEDGGRLYAFGTRAEHAAYRDALRDVSPYVLPDRYARPVPSTAWYLGSAAPLAADLGADVFLNLAGNRRPSARRGAPVVSVVHDLAQLHVAGKYDRARMFYARHVLPRAFRTCNALVAPSQATAQDVVAAIGELHPHVVPNGVDAARFARLPADDPRGAAARTALGVTGPYVIYPARFEAPGKNHANLIEAFARSRLVHSHQLVLMGADWGARAAVTAQVARLGLGRRILFPGFVDGALLPAAIGGAAAVAMVGLREGFGLPAIEALAAGVPVVSSTTGALPEVCGPLAAYADPGDVAALTAALERAIADDVLRERAGREGPARAAAFSWDRTALGLLTVCREVAR